MRRPNFWPVACFIHWMNSRRPLSSFDFLTAWVRFHRVKSETKAKACFCHRWRAPAHVRACRASSFVFSCSSKFSWSLSVGRTRARRRRPRPRWRRRWGRRRSWSWASFSSGREDLWVGCGWFEFEKLTDAQFFFLGLFYATSASRATTAGSLAQTRTETQSWRNSMKRPR